MSNVITPPNTQKSEVRTVGNVQVSDAAIRRANELGVQKIVITIDVPAYCQPPEKRVDTATKVESFFKDGHFAVHAHDVDVALDNAVRRIPTHPHQPIPNPGRVHDGYDPTQADRDNAGSLPGGVPNQAMDPAEVAAAREVAPDKGSQFSRTETRAKPPVGVVKSVPPGATTDLDELDERKDLFGEKKEG